MFALTITLLIVGSFALLSFGLAARRALRRNPCPACARSSLRWSGSRLVRAPDGSTVDIVDRGHCHACAATVFQSHRNGWWRATTTDDFPPSLAFTIPLAWRDSLRHWRILDRSRTPITRLSGSPRSTSLAIGAGLIAGFACLTVAGTLIKNPKVTTSTLRVDDIPPAVFQAASSDVNSIPVATSDWDDVDFRDDDLPEAGADGSIVRVVEPLGIRVQMSSRWKHSTTQNVPGGTVALFQRYDLSSPGVLALAVTRVPGAVTDEHLAMVVRTAISEGHYTAGLPPAEISCHPDGRRQFCYSMMGRDGVAGWAWVENGRVYLVNALIPSKGDRGAYVGEIIDIIESIQRVI